MQGVSWKKNLIEASNEISGGTRLILACFIGPECQGSHKVLDETLMDEKVVRIVERETAPVLFDVTLEKEAARRYHADWTPSFVLMDENGNELERWVGYLPPEEFISQLLLSKGLAAFHLARYEEASRLFDEIIEEHYASEFVPEAEYFRGASNYKKTGEEDDLIEACHILKESYPESTWTKRCSIWSHKQRPKMFVGYDGGGSAGSGAY